MVNDLIVFLSNYLNTANKLVSNKPCNVMCIKGCVMVHRGMHGSNYHLLSSCNRKRQKFSLPTLYQTISNKPLFWRFLFFIRLSHRLETIITRTHIEHMYFIQDIMIIRYKYIIRYNVNNYQKINFFYFEITTCSGYM